MDSTTVERCGPLACPELAKGSGRGSFQYRSTIATMGGRFLLPLSAENRLAAALDADPEARRRFDALSCSHQRRHALAVEGAEAGETRARRVTGVLAALTGS